MIGKHTYPFGVSLVICTYNGAELLPPTITHILNQKVPANIPWEVLFIDNASTDSTAEVIGRMWEPGIPMRIIREEKKGLIHARYRGISEAKYEFISFIDDDNWIDDNWIKVVYNAFVKYPEAGMIGSHNEGVYESDPPEWFPRVLQAFAIGRQGETTGDVTLTRKQIWGAGMSFRKSAFEELQKAGFESILTGRKGKNLAAGEDTELAFAFRLAGWKLWYVEEMRLRHFIAATRLDWNYVRKLFIGFGQSRAIFNIYNRILAGRKPNLAYYYAEILRQFLPRLLWRVRHLFLSGEGNPRELEYLLHKTKLTRSVRLFFRYPGIARRIMDLKSTLETGKQY